MKWRRKRDLAGLVLRSRRCREGSGSLSLCQTPVTFCQYLETNGSRFCYLPLLGLFCRDPLLFFFFEPGLWTHNTISSIVMYVQALNVKGFLQKAQTESGQCTQLQAVLHFRVLPHVADIRAGPHIPHIPQSPPIPLQHVGKCLLKGLLPCKQCQSVGDNLFKMTWCEPRRKRISVTVPLFSPSGVQRETKLVLVAVMVDLANA